MTLLHTKGYSEALPAVYENLPFEKYRAIEAVSSTFLKRFREVPASALIDKEPTADMILGSAIHSWILQGQDQFYSEFAILPEPPYKPGTDIPIHKNTNQWKEIVADFEAMNEGKIILPDHYDHVPTRELLGNVEASLLAHPMAGAILKGSRRELSLVWIDADTGLKCKARLDIDPSRRCIAELKKCARPEVFRKEIERLNYDIQIAHYFEGALACSIDVDTALFIVACPDPELGYPSAAGYFDPDWLEASRREVHRLLGLVKECQERNFFPQFKIPERIHSLDDLQPADTMESYDMPPWRFVQ
jgi:hypothetical protein